VLFLLGFLIPLVLGLSIERKFAALEVEVNQVASCNPLTCAGECINQTFCKLWSLTGEDCGGTTDKDCVPCEDRVCYPRVLGLEQSIGKCQERLRCNNKWCDGGYCVVTHRQTGKVSYFYNKSAPPVSSDTVQRCVLWAQYNDRCNGGNSSPPQDFQHCAPPLSCFKNPRNTAGAPGVCRLPVCSPDLCAFQGQQMIDKWCDVQKGYSGAKATPQFVCQPYRKVGQTCGGLLPLQYPYCDPSSLMCARNGTNYVCQTSQCLLTCTGEYCLPDANGLNAQCGGVGAPTTAPPTTTPPPTTPAPYYGGGYGSSHPSLLEVEQLPPQCCTASRRPAPQPPPRPTSQTPPHFLELAHAHANKNKQACCPAGTICPFVASINCCTNPYILCASCISSGLNTAQS